MPFHWYRQRHDCESPLSFPGRRRNSRRMLLAGVFVCASFSAVAGPPFFTDDPEPAEYKHHEFYVATQQVKTADGRSGTLPHVEYNYGVAPDTMLHVIVPYAFDRPVAGPHQSGFGDLELGVKYRFIQEAENRPMVGVFPILLLPTGNSDKGLGNDRAQLFLPLWLQKRWGEWQSYGGGGYWINNAPGAKNHWFFGWQLQKELSEHLTLGGEFFHSTAEASDERSSTGFNFGGSYNFDEHNHLLFSAGKGLSNADATNKGSLYLGYQRTW